MKIKDLLILPPELFELTYVIMPLHTKMKVQVAFNSLKNGQAEVKAKLDQARKLVEEVGKINEEMELIKNEVL